MKILSHRGYWKGCDERNTMGAFERSFAGGFGTETDLRDLDGRLVISHDPARSEALDALEFFAAHARHGGGLRLALNVKSDGLQSMLKDALAVNSTTDYFVFDMSVPDMRGYIGGGFTVFTRQSEFEPEPAFYAQAAGIWLDAFTHEWYEAALIRKHLDAGKKVCVVSPELHGRAHLKLWEMLRGIEGDGVMLCTDFPEEARAFMV